MSFDELHQTIKSGDILRLKSTVPSKFCVDQPNQFGWTLLMLAAIEGNTAIGKHLISSGALMDKRNNFGETALSLAAYKGHFKFVNLLIRSGARDLGEPHGHTLLEFISSHSGLTTKDKSKMLDILKTKIA